MSHPGAHCAGCTGVSAVPAAAFAVFCGLTWIAEHLAEVIAVSAACYVLSVAAVVALSRVTARREAAFGARLAAAHQRGTLTATVIPQVTQEATARPAIEQHFHVHHHYADSREPARVIRTALPGQAGAAITTEE